MYRPEWWSEITQDRNLLEIALDLHMSCTGSFDRPIQASINDHYALTWALNNWQDSVHSPRFDEAVRQLLIEAVYEFENLPLEKK